MSNINPTGTDLVNGQARPIAPGDTLTDSAGNALITGGGLSFNFVNYATPTSIPPEDIIPGKILVAIMTGLDNLIVPNSSGLADGTTIIFRNDSVGNGFVVKSDLDFFGGPAAGATVPGPYGQYRVVNVPIWLTLDLGNNCWQLTVGSTDAVGGDVA